MQRSFNVYAKRTHTYVHIYHWDRTFFRSTRCNFIIIEHAPITLVIYYYNEKHYILIDTENRTVCNTKWKTRQLSISWRDGIGIGGKVRLSWPGYELPTIEAARFAGSTRSRLTSLSVFSSSRFIKRSYRFDQPFSRMWTLRTLLPSRILQSREC